MKAPDDSILEFIQDHGSANPTKLSNVKEIRYSYGYLADRCSILAEYGLIRRLGNAVYVLSDSGTQYLDEELDAQMLERDADPETKSKA